MAKIPKKSGIVNAIRMILHKSREGLTSSQILYQLDCEKYPDSNEQSVRVILSQLKSKNQVKWEKLECYCCKRTTNYFFITEKGRMAITENTGVIDVISLEDYVNATSKLE